MRKLGTISNVYLEYQISCGKLSISVSELSVWATIMVSNGKFNTQIGISSRTTADVYGNFYIIDVQTIDPINNKVPATKTNT